MNNNNFFELKKITKEIMNQKTEPSPDEQFFEDDINAINENQLLGGQQDNNWSVVCTAHRVRSSNLNIERVRSI